MSPLIKTIALVCKQQNEKTEEFSKNVTEWLQNRGIQVTITHHSPAKNKNSALKKSDLILVLGGDGTFVSVARSLVGSGIPLCGVNFGRVGFLTELTTESWEKGLESALDGSIAISKRMSLSYSLVRKEKVVLKGEVVNDVVVTRGRKARLTQYEVSFDSQPFIPIRADGLIVATPTGSTGYACSAGGPILHPNISAYVVTAVCPFLCTFPPIVEGASTRLAVRVGATTSDTHLTLDGQETYPLHGGDMLFIQGEPDRLFFAEMGQLPYTKRLQRAGFISGFRKPE